MSLLTQGVYAQLFVQKGSELTVQTNGVLTVNMDVENESEIYMNEGIINFSGNWDNRNDAGGFARQSKGRILLIGANQQITGAYLLRFPSMQLEGTGVKTIKQKVEIGEELDLGNQELSVYGTKLVLLNSEARALKRKKGFISSQEKGFFYRKIDKSETYLYPMGSKKNGEVLYRPLEVDSDNHQGGMFGVSFLERDPNYDYYYRENKNVNIADVNPRFYHLLDRTEGNSKLKINYFYSSLDGYSTLASWNTKAWENISTFRRMDLLGADLDRKIVFENNEFNSSPLALVTLKAAHDLVFYNSYSPDGDSQNDTWTIGNIDNYPENEITIFNRWGGEVFKTKTFSSINRWDGSSLNEGTYYYLLRVKIDNEYKIFKGFVSLVKNQR